MLEPVVRSRQDGSAFVPDDLLVVKEPNAQQPVQNFACELAGVPDLGNIEARNESESV